MSARGTTVTVLVNGATHMIDGGRTLADLVGEITPSPRGIAVAVNADVVPRSLWGDTALVEGDAIEILTAVQGG